MHSFPSVAGMLTLIARMDDPAGTQGHCRPHKIYTLLSFFCSPDKMDEACEQYLCMLRSGLDTARTAFKQFGNVFVPFVQTVEGLRFQRSSLQIKHQGISHTLRLVFLPWKCLYVHCNTLCDLVCSTPSLSCLTGLDVQL